MNEPQTTPEAAPESAQAAAPEAPEPTAAAGAPVAADPAQDDPGAGVAEEFATALEQLPVAHAESEAHRILTRIETEVDSLLHAPLAMAQWVKDMVAEAKAKL